MADQHPLAKITGPISHLPTWFFIIGYPLFWIELYTHHASHGITSPMAWILWIGAAIILLSKKRGQLSFPKKGDSHLFWYLGALLACIVLSIVTMAGLKPIHLTQEFDCLQYHYTLPRQHLILGSFAHIPWAADDLFLLPMDFALAPFWFATGLPNKIPQLIILFGLIAVGWRLTAALAQDRVWAAPLAALVILGTHGFGIQMGTGMLDLGIAYLFLAGIDSLRLGDWFLAGVEFTFFFWSKPMMPLEAGLILAVWVLALKLARDGGWQIVDTFTLKDRKPALGLFLLLSMLVAGPFVVKSIYYAGTPFFPLAPGLMGGQIQGNPTSWHSLKAASQLWMQGSQNYGHGHGLTAFIKHWWLLAVPEEGVNNAFDYPLGLTYLLMIGPFLFFMAQDIKRRRFSTLGILAVIIWAGWWLSIQQSRFLYLPLLLIFILVISRLEKPYQGLLLGMVISLFLEIISLWGAHRYDINRWQADVLRPQDKKLLELNQRYLAGSLSGYIEWPVHDAAYAQFPVVVRQEKLPHTIAF